MMSGLRGGGKRRGIARLVLWYVSGKEVFSS